MKLIILSCTLAASLAIAAKQSSNAEQPGEAVYKKYCLACHQADGGGVPNLNPPLINTSYVTGEKGKLIKWVLQGTQEKKPIDDEYYSNNMPPQNQLSDKQIADVLTYIRSSFGNKASAISPADVKAIRSTIK